MSRTALFYIECSLEGGDFDSQCITGYLDHVFCLCGFSASHERVGSYDLAIPDRAGFHRLPACHRDGDGDDRIRRKIEVLDSFTRPMENCAAVQRHGRELMNQAVVEVGWKCVD